MIQIYTTKTCKFCKEAKEYFTSKNIEFEELDVNENEFARKEMIDQGIMSVPLIKVGDKTIIGFDKEAIDNELR